VASPPLLLRLLLLCLLLLFLLLLLRVGSLSFSSSHLKVYYEIKILRELRIGGKKLESEQCYLDQQGERRKNLEIVPYDIPSC